MGGGGGGGGLEREDRNEERERERERERGATSNALASALVFSQAVLLVSYQSGVDRIEFVCAVWATLPAVTPFSPSASISVSLSL